MVSAWSSGHVDSPDSGQHDALGQAGDPLIALFRFLGPPLTEATMGGAKG